MAKAKKKQKRKICEGCGNSMTGPTTCDWSAETDQGEMTVVITKPREDGTGPDIVESKRCPMCVLMTLGKGMDVITGEIRADYQEKIMGGNEV